MLMKKLLLPLFLLLTPSVSSSLLAQTSQPQPPSTSAQPTLEARVKPYYEWLSNEGYRPTKSEDNSWVYLTFKSEGRALVFMIEKDFPWVGLSFQRSFDEETSLEDNPEEYGYRLIAANAVNAGYRAVTAWLSDDHSLLAVDAYWLESRPEDLATYIDFVSMGVSKFGQVYEALKEAGKSESSSAGNN